MEKTLYHVLLDGRRLGPYDRRTIVGMRVRKTLTSASRLESLEGGRLTVAELVRGPLPELPPSPPPAAPQPEPLPDLSAARRGSRSVIQAVHAADLLLVEGRGDPIPPFKGEIEVRVQTKVLRLAGRFRNGLAWREDRVKFSLSDILHARLQGSVVELGIRPAVGEGLQRVRLDLRTAEAAAELAEGLPFAVPWPGSEPLAGRSARRAPRPRWLAWAALAASLLGLSAALAWVLTRA